MDDPEFPVINEKDRPEEQGNPDSLKQIINEWRENYPRFTRILMYFGILLGVLVSGNLIFMNLNFYNANLDTARYFLSALVQSQAAILSIVISLTLVAVQITASKYSFRVIEVFKKDPDMWLLLIFYVFSLIYGFFLLKEIEGNPVIEEHLGFLITQGYLLGVFTFVILPPYFLNTINLLKIDTIFKKLTDIIKFDSFANERDYDDWFLDDPLQPVFDIIHDSILNYDIFTLKSGLKILSQRIDEEMVSEKETNLKNNISGRFCENLKRSGLLALDKYDKDSGELIINVLEDFGKKGIDRTDNWSAITSISALTAIGEYSVERNTKDIIYSVENALYFLGYEAAEKRMRNVTSSSINKLERIDEITWSSESEEMRDHVATLIFKIGENIIEFADKTSLSEDRYAICDPIDSLKHIALLRLNKEKSDKSNFSIVEIGVLGYSAASLGNEKNGFDRGSREAADALVGLGLAFADLGLEYNLKIVIEQLEHILFRSVDNELLETTSSIIRFFKNLCAFTFSTNRSKEFSSAIQQFDISLVSIYLYISRNELSNSQAKEASDLTVELLKELKKSHASKLEGDLREYYSRITTEMEKEKFKDLLSLLEMHFVLLPPRRL